MRVDPSEHGRVRVAEGDEERVSPRAEHVPSAGVPHGSQKLVVSTDQSGVRVAQDPGELGRTLYVGQHERDDARRSVTLSAHTKRLARSLTTGNRVPP